MSGRITPEQMAGMAGIRIVGELDSLDRNAKAENLSFEWHRQTLLEHGEQACALLLVVMRIDNGFLHERSDA